MDIDTFTVRRVATSGCEIRDPEGNTVCWTTDEPWALLIAALLNRVEREGLGSLFGIADDGDCLPQVRNDCKRDQQEKEKR